MTFEPAPYGANLVKFCHEELKSYYQSSTTSEGCCGCMERAGKQILVTAGHLINALIVAPMMLIYDLVMATFFLLANLCTGFAFEELRERLVGHLYSAATIPGEIFKDLITALWPPAVYRGNDAARINYQAHQEPCVKDYGTYFQYARLQARIEGDVEDMIPNTDLSHVDALIPAFYASYGLDDTGRAPLAIQVGN